MTEKRMGGAGDSNRRSLRVLLVEDSAADALLLAHALERGGFRVSCERVDDQASLEAALDKQPWDVILADHSMPQFSAPEALALVKKRGLDIPFIIVSGHIEEETAVAAMRAGAHDYVMKERLARLAPAVERELREAELRRVQREYERELRQAREQLEARVEQRTRDLRTANLKLQAGLEERKRLEDELLEIAENERRRIGFDLHDDLGQKLTGLSMMLKGLQQKLDYENHACAADAQRIQALVDDVIHHTHNLARQFSALAPAGDNIGAVLKALASSVKKTFDVSCGCSVKGTVPELPGNTLLQLHKIAQEAVSNAIKHGKAKNVSIQLHNQEHQLVLTVKNDGVPFTIPEGKQNRMGLRIMNYRANTIGATFDIKPLDKNGTLVTCEVPLKNGMRRARPAAEPSLSAEAI